MRIDMLKLCISDISEQVLLFSLYNKTCFELIFSVLAKSKRSSSS